MLESSGEWHSEYITPHLLQVERISSIVHNGKSAFQSVQILDTHTFGRLLVLDGKTQSSELDEFIYHEALVQPALTIHPKPEKIFIAGGGEGATLREALSHNTVKQVVMVDIDKEVVDLCRKHLPNHHQKAFEDPRTKLHLTDALAFLENHTTKYDVIIIDVADPLEEGPCYLLFTQEFYKLATKRLNSNGVIAVQAGPTGPAFMKQCFASVAHTMKSVFKQAYLYEAFVACFTSTWGFVLGSRGADPLSFSPEKIDAILSQRLSRPLRYYDGITHRGMFSVPKYLRDSVARDARLITKDNPLYVP